MILYIVDMFMPCHSSTSTNTLTRVSSCEWPCRAVLCQVSMSALAAGWNALVLDLRERDLLSNKELAALTFEQLQLTHSQKQHLRELPHVGHLGLTSVLPAR